MSLSDRINEKLSNLEQKIQELSQKVEDNDTRYNQTLEKVFGNNQYYAENLQGRAPPHGEYSVRSELKQCRETGNWPHLYHTFNPQLNNMSDLILEILNKIDMKKEALEKILSEIQAELHTVIQQERSNDLVHILEELRMMREEKGKTPLHISPPWNLH